MCLPMRMGCMSSDSFGGVALCAGMHLMCHLPLTSTFLGQQVEKRIFGKSDVSFCACDQADIAGWVFPE